jgi:hypothetical protein
MSSADPNPTALLPHVDPRRGPSRFWLGAVVALLVLGGLGLAALVGGDGPPESQISTVTVTSVLASDELFPISTTALPAVSPSTTRAAQPSTTVPPARERLTNESRLSLDGVGPVDIGMTLEEASAAAGTPIRTRPSDPFGPECQFAYATAVPGVAFMVINGRIARVDAGEPGGDLRTVSGIGRGATEDEVKRTYPDRIRVEGHPYVPTGRYLVYVPADAALSHLSMIFETDGRVVTRFRAGLTNAVAQIEGCS